MRKSSQASTADRKVEAECVAELRWNLGNTYKHHKMALMDIEVDLLRFRRVE